MKSSVPKTELRRFVMYGAVGAVNTAICYLFFVGLVHWCRWHHHPALAADYVFGVGLGYALHRRSTFADRRHLRNALSKYTITLVLTFVANFLLLDALVRGAFLEPLAAQAVAMTVATLVSYSVQSRWVFHSHGEDAPAAAAGETPRRVTETTRRAA